MGPCSSVRSPRLRTRGTGAEQQRAWASTGNPDAALIKLATPRDSGPPLGTGSPPGLS